MNLTTDSSHQKLIFTHINTGNFFTYEGKEYRAVSRWPMQLGHREKILKAISEGRFMCNANGVGHNSRGDAFARHFQNFKYDFEGKESGWDTLGTVLIKSKELVDMENTIKFIYANSPEMFPHTFSVFDNTFC